MAFKSNGCHRDAKLDRVGQYEDTPTLEGSKQNFAPEEFSLQVDLGCSGADLHGHQRKFPMGPVKHAYDS